MRVQVVDLDRCCTGTPQRLPHGLDRTIAVGRRIGDAIAGKRIAIAGQFGVNVCAAPARRVPFLQHQEARAFAQQKAVAGDVERPARALRGIVVGRQRRQQAKAGDADGTDHRIVATREHVVDRSAPYQLQCRAQSLPAGCARRVYGRRVPANAMTAGNEGQARRAITAAEGQRIVGAVIGQQQVGMEFTIGGRVHLRCGQVREIHTHHAGAERASPARRIGPGGADAGVAQRLFRRRECKAMGSIGQLEELAIADMLTLVEALDLGRNVHRKAAGVESGNRRAATPATQDCVPRGGDVVADGCDQAQARDRDSFARGHGIAAAGATNSTRAVAMVLPSSSRAVSAMRVTRSCVPESCVSETSARESTC